MEILHVFLLVVSMAFFQPSKSEVFIPFKEDSYFPSYGLYIICFVRNESFIGWFKINGNIKIPVVASRDDVKDKPAVVIETDRSSRKTCKLIFQRGFDRRSAWGKYKCKGEKNEEIAEVVGRFNLDSLKTRQSFRLGANGTIILGAFSRPLSKFKWKKDKLPIDFSQKRLKLKEDDGSIHIYNVQKSDAGVYDVNINWENRVIRDVRITVTVKDSEVFVPFLKGTLHPLFGLSIACYIRNEQFIGWFKADSNFKIPVVPSRADVKAKPTVVIATINKTIKEALLMFPRGSSASNVGKYVCEGEIHSALVKVNAKT